jgi:thiamine-monophosphate kinase
MGEFEAIDRFFARLGALRPDVLLGVGDDAALVVPPPGELLALCADTLVEGVHFPADLDPADIGWRSLAVNLSDLAAMGAKPAWALLALTLPRLDEAMEDWLEAFARGFGALAQLHGVALVGGDTTRGPLAITVQLGGHVPPGQALLRSGARVGDLVYVTGWPGDAAAGLALLQGRRECASRADRAALETRFRRPDPRVAVGLKLRGLATACIDISDGLAQDLGRLVAASGVGVRLRTAELPRSRALHALADELAAVRFTLGGGDDYELLFTGPAVRTTLLRATLAGMVPCHCIGEVVAAPGVRCLDAAGQEIQVAGWDHFRQA